MPNSTTHYRMSNGSIQTISRNALNAMVKNYVSTSKIRNNLKNAQNKYTQKTKNVRNLEMSLKNAKAQQNKARVELMNVQKRHSSNKTAHMNTLKNSYKVNGPVAKKRLVNYGRNMKNYGKSVLSKVHFPTFSFRKSVV